MTNHTKFSYTIILNDDKHDDEHVDITTNIPLQVGMRLQSSLEEVMNGYVVTQIVITPDKNYVYTKKGV